MPDSKYYKQAISHFNEKYLKIFTFLTSKRDTTVINNEEFCLLE